MPSAAERLDAIPLRHRRLVLRDDPTAGLKGHIRQIYRDNQVNVGWPQGELRGNEDVARPNTAAFIGAQRGDEGKGRFIDNKIEELSSRPGVTKVLVDRENGGNNAGHSVRQGKKRLALHVVPSGPFYDNTILVADRGMVLHSGDLMAEVEYVEDVTGSKLTSQRMHVSEEAAHCTDLERAKEVFNRQLAEGAKGGTGRGISPTIAGKIDRTGKSMGDLVRDDWRDQYGKRYDIYQRQFAAEGRDLANYDVPDYPTSIKTGNEEKRKVGTRQDYLDRLAEERDWLLRRRYVTNTRPIHQRAYRDPHTAVLIEGAQGITLDPEIGSRPDVTSTPTTLYGVQGGTGFWRVDDIAERNAVFKGPYESTVGAYEPLTLVRLPEDLKDLPPDATPDQLWAAWVREVADEYGTTTRRPRGIARVDLDKLRYNLIMGGVDTMVATHLDVARPDEPIKICTHYTDSRGRVVPYQPGIQYQEGLTPHYVELPGWDGMQCREARRPEDLPEDSLKFLAFVQKRTGFPIVAATTGPDRANFIEFPGYRVIQRAA